jgi:hypothetical protein
METVKLIVIGDSAVGNKTLLSFLVGSPSSFNNIVVKHMVPKS